MSGGQEKLNRKTSTKRVIETVSTPEKQGGGDMFWRRRDHRVEY